MPPLSQSQHKPRTPWGQSSTVISTNRQRERPQTTATVLSSRTPNVQPRDGRGVKSIPQQKESLQTKTKKKTEYEEKYEEALAQLALLQQKLEQQTLVSMQLERNVLEYYYTNAISFEDYDGERVPQQNSLSHHYYFTSLISKARRERRERRAREEKILQEEKRRVQSLVEDIQTRILHGTLAEERIQVEEAEKELKTLQQHLAEKLDDGKACQVSLLEELNRQKELQQEYIDCEKKIQKMEEVKEQQMMNVDATRVQLEKQREELVVAQAELRKREDVVAELRETIVRLTRKRKQRE
ncbi:uncharacterized protein TM35_000014330 [Trypanosoma theileri]|uniref:Uncharacterized protein n=1 Tax=Trypanosoma theileri TaxID=67003 RepID=A0A1X0P9G8_9TRYP|nr:uncharacterized protein TM35_000014330 [Trypanosoma theileri]ORC93556.1 hypothetical protein TM35_000014330 [Trypanosoma theileri]